MDKLVRLKDTFVDYLFPLAKRRRTIGPSTATPAKENEHTFLAPASESRGDQERATLFGKIRAKYYTSPDNENPRKRGRDEFEYDASGVSPNDSVSQINSSEAGFEIGEEDEEEITEILQEDGDEVEIKEEDLDAAAQAKVQEYLERQAELEMRRQDIAEVRKQGDWHQDELFLYERLTMRSYEPLIPEYWKIDFPTLPEGLFIDDPDKTLINYNFSSSGRGVKALQELLRLGPRVRERVAAGRASEPLIEREIKRYITYTEKDGGYHRKCFLPVLSVVKARPGQEIDAITKAIQGEMTFLTEKHREALDFQVDEISEPDANKRRPPVLYGMIVARTLVIFVTLDSASTNGHLRHIIHFDFNDKKLDAWNGFAIAIMAICARNYTMSIKDELEDDDEPISDPDL